jgi:hypothetical protein
MQWLQRRRERVEVVRQQRNRRDRARNLDELLRRGRLLRRQQHVDDVVAQLTGSNVRGRSLAMARTMSSTTRSLSYPGAERRPMVTT